MNQHISDPNRAHTSWKPTARSTEPARDTLIRVALWVAIITGIVFTANILFADYVALSAYIKFQTAASEISDLVDSFPTAPIGDSAVGPDYCDPSTGMKLDGTYC